MPIQRNETRWTSTSEMIKRYLAMKEFLPADEQIAVPAPPLLQIWQLMTLFNGPLVKIPAATWCIQKDELSVSDIRKVFDALTSLDVLEIVNFGAERRGIGPRIVQISLFEPGIGKI